MKTHIFQTGGTGRKGTELNLIDLYLTVLCSVVWSHLKSEGASGILLNDPIWRPNRPKTQGMLADNRRNKQSKRYCSHWQHEKNHDGRVITHACARTLNSRARGAYASTLASRTAARGIRQRVKVDPSGSTNQLHADPVTASCVFNVGDGVLRASQDHRNFRFTHARCPHRSLLLPRFPATN
jgi:hypothetical protein